MKKKNEKKKRIRELDIYIILIFNKTIHFFDFSFLKIYIYLKILYVYTYICCLYSYK
jgi:hypothetical protein